MAKYFEVSILVKILAACLHLRFLQGDFCLKGLTYTIRRNLTALIHELWFLFCLLLHGRCLLTVSFKNVSALCPLLASCSLIQNLIRLWMFIHPLLLTLEVLHLMLSLDIFNFCSS